MSEPYELDPKFIAGVKMIERTGAKSFRIGWSDEEDGPPVVWYALAVYKSSSKKIKAETASALNPVEAVLRLCEKLIDGGLCAHCGKVTIFLSDTDTELFEVMGCVYAWDPELATFRRGCE